MLAVTSASAAPSLYSQGQVPPNLSVLSISTASVLNVRGFGAVGNGTTDDTAAFATAITQVNTLLAAGTPATLYIPAGVYLINGATPLPTFTRGGSLIGDGLHKTYIKLGPSYSGDLFSWSEAWALNAYNGTSLSVAADQAGPAIKGLTILGSIGSPNQQNAFVFYDRDDFVNMRDVAVYFLNGRALYMGVAKNVPGHAYVRESKFTDLMFWMCGTASVPAVEINSVGPAGEDATNELSFYGLDLLAPVGQGLVIRNSNASIPVRLIRFFGLRAEGGTAGGSGDLVVIGDPTLTGNVNNVQIYGFESNTAASGHTALRFTAPSAASAPYNILVEGSIPTSNGDGVHIDAGRQIRLLLSDVHTPTGTGITVGPSSLVGANIEVDGDGAETTWTYNIDPTSVQNLRTPAYPLLGNPAAGTARAITAGPPPDGTAVGGNSRGAGAVDFQTSRLAGYQAATGPYAALLGGIDNSAQSTGTVQVGGQGNVNSGFFGFGGGGQANVVSGFGASVIGGTFNVASGAFGVILGGNYATDRGRLGTVDYASGNFTGSAVGDAQFMVGVLRGSIASGASGQLTADGGAPGSANILNLTSGMAGTYHGYVTVRDTVTGAMYSFFIEFGAKRPSSAASTAVTWKNILAKGGDAALANVTLSLSADTVNGGVTLTANNSVSPSGNALHVSFTPIGAETQ
ncbi:MAG: glycosyl hydrolase family 28-related protein [Acetobacteraceae bacterium]